MKNPPLWRGRYPSVLGLLVALVVGCAARALPARLSGTPQIGVDHAARLTIHFTGMRTDEGALVYAIFDRESAFDRSTDPLNGGSLEIVGGAATLTIELPPGEYAIKAFQDANRNGRLDRGAMGVPQEPYGFSNDARGMFGPAGWKSARFRLETSEREVEIPLR